MENTNYTAIARDMGAFIVFLVVVLFIGRQLITALVKNITEEMRSGFTSICERIDAQIGSRSTETQTILSALQEYSNMMIGLISNRPMCHLNEIATKAEK